MSSPTIAVIRRAYRAFAARDLEQLMELADPGIELHTMTGELAGRQGPYRGYAGLAQYLDDVARTWDEIELLPREYEPRQDGSVLVRGRVRAWRNNAFIDAPNAWVWRLRSGLITEVQILADDETTALLSGRQDPPPPRR